MRSLPLGGAPSQCRHRAGAESENTRRLDKRPSRGIQIQIVHGLILLVHPVPIARQDPTSPASKTMPLLRRKHVPEKGLLARNQQKWHQRARLRHPLGYDDPYEKPARQSSRPLQCPRWHEHRCNAFRPVPRTGGSSCMDILGQFDGKQLQFRHPVAVDLRYHFFRPYRYSSSADKASRRFEACHFDWAGGDIGKYRVHPAHRIGGHERPPDNRLRFGRLRLQLVLVLCPMGDLLFEARPAACDSFSVRIGNRGGGDKNRGVRLPRPYRSGCVHCAPLRFHNASWKSETQPARST